MTKGALPRRTPCLRLISGEIRTGFSPGYNFLYSLASFLPSATRQITALASTVSENAVLGGFGL